MKEGLTKIPESLEGRVIYSDALEQILLDAEDTRYFDKIEKELTNSELLVKVLSDSLITEQIVAVLDWCERNWIYPVDLGKIRGVIPESEKWSDKWLCLVCIGACAMEGFSFGNVLRFEDYQGESDEDDGGW